MIRLYKQGDHVEARRLNEATEPAYELLKIAPNPIAVKAASYYPEPNQPNTLTR